jgi:hypothetical protein
LGPERLSRGILPEIKGLFDDLVAGLAFMALQADEEPQGSSRNL